MNSENESNQLAHKKSSEVYKEEQKEQEQVEDMINVEENEEQENNV